MVIATVAAGEPGIIDILTAIGTVGAVLAAVGIALWTDWRVGERMKGRTRAYRQDPPSKPQRIGWRCAAYPRLAR